MDSLIDNSSILSQPISLTPNQTIFNSNINPSNKSPQLQKQYLIQKIRSYQYQNNQLQAKYQTLQNTICDLRNLLHFASIQNEQYIKYIQEQNIKFADKSARLGDSLKYSHKQGNHLQNCALFWREFIL